MSDMNSNDNNSEFELVYIDVDPLYRSDIAN